MSSNEVMVRPGLRVERAGTSPGRAGSKDYTWPVLRYRIGILTTSHVDVTSGSSRSESRKIVESGNTM